MPDLRPFRGVRYSPMGPLKDLVCPPYDVISSEEQQKLYERHPYNAVRIELPFSTTGTPTERYAKAANEFRQWLERGVLVVDDAPCMYVYRQDFVTPEGRRARVEGAIGALRLEEYGFDSGVLPHEHTMPGPIEDRLALLRACPVNISPIYAIYRGGGQLAPYFDSLASRPPDARFTDDGGTLHRVWAIRSRAEIDLLAEAVRPGPLVIADGHHRYETALAYHVEQDGLPGGHDAVMTFCVDADAEDLVVFSFHRAVRSRLASTDVRDRLLQRFAAQPLNGQSPRTALISSRADHPMVFVLPDQNLLVEVGADEVDARLPERSPAWRSLDVVALHEVVLPEIFPDGMEHLHFTRDPDEVGRLVRERSYSGGVLLRPLKAGDVIDVATSGERMPQKASYFWPKAVTGLVFRTLR